MCPASIFRRVLPRSKTASDLGKWPVLCWYRLLNSFQASLSSGGAPPKGKQDLPLTLQARHDDGCRQSSGAGLPAAEAGRQGATHAGLRSRWGSLGLPCTRWAAASRAEPSGAFPSPSPRDVLRSTRRLRAEETTGLGQRHLLQVGRALR